MGGLLEISRNGDKLAEEARQFADDIREQLGTLTELAERFERDRAREQRIVLRGGVTNNSGGVADQVIEFVVPVGAMWIVKRWSFSIVGAARVVAVYLNQPQGGQNLLDLVEPAQLRAARANGELFVPWNTAKLQVIGEAMAVGEQIGVNLQVVEYLSDER